MARDPSPPSAFLRAAFSMALLARWKRRQGIGATSPAASRDGW
jgi:hypothetical protein